ncbi:MAG: DMT family transporter [Bacteroidales bacterium]|jgi:drug/metabolite transporter (DMT)-like permease
MGNGKPNTLFLKWVILIFLVLTWGSSYILMKRGLEGFSSAQVGALRISITFLVLIPLVIKRIKSVPAKKYWLLIISGILGNGIPAFLFAHAQEGIDSEISGILNTAAPLFALIMGAVFFNLKTRWYNIVGVFVGLAGAVGLLSVGIKGFDNNFRYGIYVLIATFLYSININIVKKYFKEIDSITITSMAFVVMGVLASIYLFTDTDFVSRIGNTAGLIAFGYISILAVMGTAIANMLYNKLIKMTSVLFASSVTYLIPIVAIMWGILDGEPFYLGYVFWILMIFLGLYLVNRERKKNDERIFL